MGSGKWSGVRKRRYIRSMSAIIYTCSANHLKPSVYLNFFTTEHMKTSIGCVPSCNFDFFVSFPHVLKMPSASFSCSSDTAPFESILLPRIRNGIPCNTSSLNNSDNTSFASSNRLESAASTMNTTPSTLVKYCLHILLAAL